MSDRPPPLPRLPRLQTQTERDLSGLAARKERSVPEPLDEDVTGKYEGVQREEMRERRPTPLRIKLLEKKSDDLQAGLGRVEAQNAVLNAKMDGFSGQISLLVGSVQQLAAREQVAYAARVEVDTARQKTEIGDVADARAARRKFYLTVACSLVSGGGLTWLLRYLGVL